MADEDNLTLQINKVVTSVDNNRVEYGNSERGKVLDVTVIGTNHEAFDLTGKTIRFAENKENGKIVVDDQADSASKAPDGAGVFTRTADDDKIGHFKYQYSRYVYQKSGEAWFEIYSDADHVDVTQKFYIDIDNSTLIDAQNDNYISSLTALEATYRTIIKQTQQETTNALNSFKDALNKAQTDATNSSNKAKADALAAIKIAQDNATKTLNDLTSQYDGYLAKYNALEAKINADIKTINDNATAEINSIKSDWSEQANAINADAKTKIDAAIAAVETARDNAINQAVSDFSNQRDNLQADYNSWKQDTVNSFNGQLATLQEKIDSETKQQSDLKAAIDSARAAVDKITDVDFTQFAHKDDVDKALKSIDFGKIGIKGKYLADVNGTLKDKIWYPAKQTDGSWTFNIYDDDHTAEVASSALSKAESNEGGINQLNARFDKYAGNQAVKNADANAITTSGTYFIDSPGNNFPIDHWGVLVVHQANEDGNIRLEQTFYPDDNSLPWFRMKITDNWKPWYQVASKEDINNLNSKIDSNDKATITTGYDWSEGNSTNETKTLQQTQLVDQQVLKGAVDRMSDLQNQINGRATNSKVNVDAPLFRRITSSNTWQDILGVANGNQVLVSIRDDSNGGNTLGENSAAIAFGGGDTKGVLSVGYANHKARIMGGNVDRPQWQEDIAWKSDIDNLNNKYNGYDSRIGNLERKIDGLTPFTIITQAQYDKLTAAQKQSGTYGISG